MGLGFIFLNIPGGGAALALAVIIMITLGEILSMPFMNSYWISRTQKNNMGQYAALYTMSWSAAQTLGPMLGALLAQGAGFQVLWWVVGSISIAAALLFRRLEKNGR